MWHAGEGWGWWMLFGWAWMIVFWGLIIWAVYALVSRRSEPDSGPNAIEILQRRYASGELSDQQYEEMRARLTSTGASGSG